MHMTTYSLSLMKVFGIERAISELWCWTKTEISA